MDVFCKRFPHVIKTVLKNLDNKSLSRTKRASKEICEFLDNERFYWVRIINKYSDNFEGFEESWKEDIYKTPIEIVETQIRKLLIYSALLSTFRNPIL